MRRLLLPVMLAMLVGACSSTSEPGSGITKVISYPDTVVLLVGDSARALSAFTTDSDLVSHAAQTRYEVFWKPITASWSSSNGSVVTVDDSGRTTGISAGEATVTAKAGSGSSTTKVYVLRYQPALQFVELAPGFSAMCGRTADAHVFCTTRLAPYLPVSPPGAFGTNAPADRCRTESNMMYAFDYLYGRCSHVPLEVEGTHRFIGIAVGTAGTGYAPPTACGLDDAGSVWCWGQQPARESQLPSLKAIAAFSQGDDQSYCGLTQTGAALCWAIGKPPTAVDSTHQFASLSPAVGSVCALDGEGAAWCWGSNESGVLGDSTTTDHASPAPVHTQVRFTSIVLGASRTTPFHGVFACALDGSGEPYCWGGGPSTPAPVQTSESFVSIAIAYDGACGVTQARTITCWTPGVPGTIAGPPGTDWRRVFGGPYDMCGIAASGRVACWTRNTATNTWNITDIPRGG